MAQFDTSANMGSDMILKFIKERMEEKEITNYRLFQLTGISQATLGRYFSKETDMNLKNFLKICGALELRPYIIPAETDTSKFEFLHFN